jgi:hypothetical protein
VLLFGAGVFGAFQVAGQVEHVADFARGEVQHAEEVAVAQIEGHGNTPCFGAGWRAWPTPPGDIDVFGVLRVQRFKSSLRHG